MATILVCFFYSTILLLTQVAIDDIEFICSASDLGTPQDQEYFEHIADLQ